MPVYVHKCNQCKKGKAVEVEYSMSFVGKEQDLPSQILKQITCTKHGLKSRIPQEPQLAGSSGGTFKNEYQLSVDKRKQRKIRSKHHFKNAVLPGMKEGNIKEHFKRKYKNTIYKDHEKLK